MLLDVVGEPDRRTARTRVAGGARLALGRTAGARGGTRRARVRRGERPALGRPRGEAAARRVPSEPAGRVARGAPRVARGDAGRSAASAVLGRLPRRAGAVRVRARGWRVDASAAAALGTR